MRAASIHFQHGFAAFIAAEIAAHPDLVCEYPKALVRVCAEISDGASHMEGEAIEAELYRPVGALLERYDALIIPTSCQSSLRAGDDYLDGLTVAGVKLDQHLENFFTPVFNIMSRCPVLAVPSGVGAGERPHRACRSPGAHTTT